METDQAAFARPSRLLMLNAVALAWAAILAVSTALAQQPSDDALWRALEGGSAFAIMRHAVAPGTGDPAHIDLADCATQRNLSEEGRNQARSIGADFSRNGIEEAVVMSSAWCRCQDTAALLGLGPVQTLPVLNSFFSERQVADERTADLKTWLAGYAGEKPLILVTHQVNITALTGVYPTSGEVVVFRLGDNGEIDVLGSF